MTGAGLDGAQLVSLLWRSALFCAALLGPAALGLTLLLRGRAAARHTLLLAALLLAAGAPLWLLLAARLGGPGPAARPSAHAGATAAASDAVDRLAIGARAPAPAPHPGSPWSAPPGPLSPWWAWGWAAGAALGLLRLAHGGFAAAALRRRAYPPDPHRARQLGLAPADPVPVRLSDDIATAAVVGAWRPTILLGPPLLEAPASALAQVLAHERAHAARRDPLWGLIQRLVGALYWFHPLVHLVNRAIDRAREEACDDQVLLGHPPPHYARTLLALAGLHPTGGPHLMGVLRARPSLESRIRHILAPPRHPAAGAGVPLRLAASALGLVIVIGGGRLSSALAPPPPPAAWRPAPPAASRAPTTAASASPAAATVPAPAPAASAGRAPTAAASASASAAAATAPAPAPAASASPALAPAPALAPVASVAPTPTPTATTPASGSTPAPVSPPPTIRAGSATADEARIFEQAGPTAEGAFVLHDPATRHTTVINPTLASRPLTPASTFKMVVALLGIDAGVIPHQHQLLRWDGHRDPHGDIRSWNQDHDLQSAMRTSATWYFTEILRRLDPAATRAAIVSLDYGNRDPSGDPLRFWLDGALRISAEGQVRFLTALAAGRLPVSPRARAILDDVTRLDSRGPAVLYGKTGTATGPDEVIAWLVGHVERQGHTHVYATLLRSPAGTDPDPLMAARLDITRTLLARHGAY